jgi:hypothetical protein
VEPSLRMNVTRSVNLSKESKQTEMTPKGTLLCGVYSDAFPLGSFPSGLLFSQTQIVVVSHAQALIEELTVAPCKRLHLEKEFGETILGGATLFNKPKWSCPTR